MIQRETNLKLLLGRTIVNTSSLLKGTIVNIESEDVFDDCIIEVLIDNKTKYLSLKNVYINGIYKFDSYCSEILDNVISNEKAKTEAEIRDISRLKINKDHVIDNFHLSNTKFLSNFYRCDIEYNGKTYKNAEAAFQAQKCLERSNEFTNLTGSQAKRLGKRVPLRSDWDSVKLNIMREILICKFTQNPDLASSLVLTGDCELINGNFLYDYYWGVSCGKGQNNLGIILMKIRDQLQVEEAAQLEEDNPFNTCNESFSKIVKLYLDGNGVTNVTGIKGNKYKVRLSNDKTKVELLDLPNLEPIDLSVFDEVERCLDNGITVKGSARSKVGSPQCDKHTIIGNIAYNCYGKHDGDTIVDATCYIYAILKSSGCIYIQDNEIKKCLSIIYNDLIW